MHRPKALDDDRSSNPQGPLGDRTVGSGAILTELRTEDLPAADRFGRWHGLTANALLPTIVHSAQRDDFLVTLRTMDFGSVQVSAITYRSLEVRRTPKLIRWSDPELYQMSLMLRGDQRIIQAGRDTALRSYDLMLYDSSRPLHGRVAAAERCSVAAVVAQFPKAQFPLPLERVDRLLAARLPACEGIGALLARFLMRLTKEAGRYRPSDAARLGIVLLDLVVVLLAHELDADSSVPRRSTGVPWLCA